MAGLLQSGRFFLTIFLQMVRIIWLGRSVAKKAFCDVTYSFDCTLQIWTLLWIVSFMMEMWKWCGDNKIDMYVKRPAKYRGTTIECEKCRAKCQLRCTFHFHQCRQKSRNRQWATHDFNSFFVRNRKCIKEQKTETYIWTWGILFFYYSSVR